MNLCSNGHNEVCYESRSCPVCDKMEEIKDLENQIEKLQGEVEEWKNAG